MAKLWLANKFDKWEEQSDGTIIVKGVVSSPTLDVDGDRIDAAVVAEAIPDYIKSGTVREMHDNIAAGRPVEMWQEGQETFARIKVVDKGSCQKIKEGVLKAFSIGGDALRDGSGKIVKLKLKDISLVDLPNNPDCVFKVAKFEPVKKAARNLKDGAMTPTLPVKDEAYEGEYQVEQGLAHEKVGHPVLHANDPGHHAHEVAPEEQSDYESMPDKADMGENPSEHSHDGVLPEGHKHTHPKGSINMTAPGQETHKAMYDELTSKMDGIVRELSIMTDRLNKMDSAKTEFVTKSDLSVDVKKLAEDFNVVKAQLKSAEDKIIEGNRNDLIAKMSFEGRAPINPETGVGYTDDQLSKMDLGILRVLAANAPTVPLHERAISKSDSKNTSGKTGTARTQEIWERMYPSTTEMQSRR